jgi:lantibiotic modifying enzyme
MRPETTGGYIGLGSRITGWLLLGRLGALDEDPVARALDLAEQISAGLETDESYDLMIGMAGAIVPLLRLAEHSSEQRWTDLAVVIGERLAGLAAWRDDIARWCTAKAPAGLGGLAHGATGIGWALARLAAATGETRFDAVADAAFRYEESLFDPVRGGWRDLRG